ncbi:MAG TPA: FmdB family zinc ribbon protein [Gemmatimonadales bacterium]
MPTYRYRCLSHGHEFDRFHKMSVTARPKCPECGSRTERLISGGAGLVFKGSGFYITDYKRAGEAKGGEESLGKPEKTDKAAPAEKAAQADRDVKDRAPDKPAKPTKSAKSPGAET